MRQLSLVKSLSAKLGTESAGFWMSSALAVHTGMALLGIHMLVGSLCQDFLGRGEEAEQQGGNRQQTLTLELSMTLVPPQENINHFSSNTIFVSTE